MNRQGRISRLGFACWVGLILSVGVLAWAAGAGSPQDAHARAALPLPQGAWPSFLSASAPLADAPAASAPLVRAANHTQAAEGDLVISKVGFPEPVVAGRVLTYSLLVTNTGLISDVTGVVLTDTLPAGVELLSATASQGACAGADPVTCSLDALPAGATAAVTIAVTVDPAASGTLVNTAEVGASLLDPDPLNNQATFTSTVTAEADLAIAKGDAPDPVVAGETLTYTLLVTNSGPSNAASVVVTDELPAAVALLSAASSQGACAGDEAVVCNVGGLGVDASATITLVVTVSPDASGSVLNSAEVRAATTDPNLADNSASATTSVETEADLAITKGDAPDPVVAGETLTYTLWVTNSGPSNAATVVVTDELPTAVTLLSAVSSQGACADDEAVVCDVDGLDVDASAAITLVVAVSPNASGPLVNIAEVSAATTDPNPANNSASASTAVNVEADLLITKADQPDPAAAGSLLTYTLWITNAGPSRATSLTMNDYLPSQVTFVSASAGCAYRVAQHRVNCSPASLDAGAGQMITITVRISAAASGSIANSALVVAATSDPDLGNNSFAVSTWIIARADLAVAKTDAPDPVVAGQVLTYTLLVTNNGPSNAATVVVTDELPAAVTLLSAVSTQGVCAGDEPVVCSVGALGAGASATVTLRARVVPAATGSLDNTAWVAASTPDPSPANNSATASTSIRIEADLLISKADQPDPVAAGSALTYTLTVLNRGPSRATSVVITDMLPSETTFVAASAGCQYQSALHQVVCAIGAIGVNTSGAATIAVSVDPGASGVITNTAEVSAPAIDLDPASNTVSAPTTVTSQADLALAKVHQPDPVVPGQMATYMLTITNHGPSHAVSLAITDTLPVGVVLQSLAASQGIHCTTDEAITCSRDDLDAGESVTITLTVTVDAAANGVLTNTAEVTSDIPDPHLANNSVSDPANVLSLADLAVAKGAQPDPVVAGRSLTYTLLITNYGPTRASALVITDTLPAQTTVVSMSAGCVYQSAFHRVACAADELLAGASLRFTVTVAVTSPLPNGVVLANTVSVSSNAPDPVSANNMAQTSTVVQSAPILALEHTSSSQTVAAGDLLTYTLTYTNTGNESGTNAIITDTLDAHTVFQYASPPPSAIISDTLVFWAIDSLPPGPAQQIVLTVRARLPLANGTVITNRAYLDCDQIAPIMAAHTATVTSAPVLYFHAANDVSTVSAGDRITYTLVYTNAGNETAYSLTITDTLPQYTSYVGCAIASGACLEVSPGQVRFTIPALTAPATGYASVVVRVDDSLPVGASEVTNRATLVAPALPVPIVVDDVDPISTQPDLSLSVTHNPSLFSPGKALTYTVSYANFGHMDAEGVVITTTLPPSTTYTGSGWATSDGRVYTHTVGNLAAGEEGPQLGFSVRYANQPDIRVPIFHTPFAIAAHSSAGADADPADNTFTVTIGVPDLVITSFTIDPPTPEANAPVTFTVVIRNTGTGMAHNPYGGGGFYLDIYTAPVLSYPWDRYSDKDIYAVLSPLAAGAVYTAQLQYSPGFTETEIVQIKAFYAKVDTHAQNPYGLVPEFSEMNNVAHIPLLRHRLYCPLVMRSVGGP